MPSETFFSLANSQLELLANSLLSRDGKTSRVKTVTLYLPQENSNTGQLEFLPVVLYPSPTLERVFIAMDADSKVPPSLPKTLTRLPGFSDANSLLPGYPMMSCAPDAIGVGVVEEVFCELTRSTASLSVPLVHGPQTVGVLIVSPKRGNTEEAWSDKDRKQVSLAAQSLSLALSMDASKTEMMQQQQEFQLALEDQLHQVKNPLQALRTYGKLLQRRIADDQGESSIPRLLALAEHLMVQSDRVVDLLSPVDNMLSLQYNNNKREDSFFLFPMSSVQSNDTTTASMTWYQAPFATASEQVMAFMDQGEAAADAFWGSNDDDLYVIESMMDEPMQMSFIADVLDPVLTTFSVIACEQDIRWHVRGHDSDLPGVFIKPKLLQEAITNILDNAMKYVVTATNSDEPPLVRVSVAPNPSDTPGVSIWIEDNGPGVPPREQELVFERGYRGDITKRLVAGSGIGLDIARALVQEMGGRLELSTEQEAHQLSGAVFKIILYRDPTLHEE